MQTKNEKVSDTSNKAAEDRVAESTSESVAPTPLMQQAVENCGTNAAAKPTHVKDGGCCGGCGG